MSRIPVSTSIGFSAPKIRKQLIGPQVNLHGFQPVSTKDHCAKQSAVCNALIFNPFVTGTSFPWAKTMVPNEKTTNPTKLNKSSFFMFFPPHYIVDASLSRNSSIFSSKVSQKWEVPPKANLDASKGIQLEASRSYFLEGCFRCSL
jgi:hypothetical protein